MSPQTVPYILWETDLRVSKENDWYSVYQHRNQPLFQCTSQPLWRHEAIAPTNWLPIVRDPTSRHVRERRQQSHVDQWQAHRRQRQPAGGTSGQYFATSQRQEHPFPQPHLHPATPIVPIEAQSQTVNVTRSVVTTSAAFVSSVVLGGFEVEGQI